MTKLWNTRDRCVCGDWLDAEHLCDDPGPSLHGDAYTTLVAAGVYRAPDGEYLVTPARLASVLGEEAAARIVAACLDDEADAIEIERAREAHRVARERLRRAADRVRALAAMRVAEAA